MIVVLDLQSLKARQVGRLTWVNCPEHARVRGKSKRTCCLERPSAPKMSTESEEDVHIEGCYGQIWKEWRATWKNDPYIHRMRERGMRQGEGRINFLWGQGWQTHSQHYTSDIDYWNGQDSNMRKSWLQSINQSGSLWFQLARRTNFYRVRRNSAWTGIMTLSCWLLSLAGYNSSWIIH